MSLYTREIDNTELFKLYKKLVGIDGIGQDEIKILTGLVLTVANQVGPQMANINLTFKQYTDHSLTHLLNIADLIYKFLPQSKKKGVTIGLNALELTLLWTGILLHDVGMFVTEAEKEAELKTEAYRKYKLRCQDRVEAAARARKAGNELRARAIEDAMVAEYYRRVHARRSNAYIQKHFADEFKFRESEFVKVAADLAESHNWQVFQRETRLSHEPSVAGLEKDHRIGSVPVNLQYLACCLRMGDILDFDRSRTPLVVFEHMDFTENISEVEWNKHRSIKGWKIDQREVYFQAECTKPEYYVAVQEFLTWVDAELENFERIVETFKEKEQERYPLVLPPRVKRHKVKMANPNHIAGAFKYQLEFDQILKLLMDRSLYPDPALFLRELLQNSLDACRYQSALAQDANMGDKYEPRIDVWDYSQDAADPRIEFRDNGIGMNRETIESYFLRVGKSFYRSPEFMTERELLAEKGIYLDSCSRFGIGFLSCFLAGDKIEVDTYREGHKPMRITITGPSKYFLVEELVATQPHIPYASPIDRSTDGPPQYPGTKVTVHLRPDWRQHIEATELGFVWDTIHTYAVAAEYEIYVHLPGQDARVVSGKEFFEPTIPEGYFKEVEAATAGGKALINAMKFVSIPLPPNDDDLIFEGGLWVVMFDDGTEYGSPRRGWLELRFEEENEYLFGNNTSIGFLHPAFEFLTAFGWLNKTNRHKQIANALKSNDWETIKLEHASQREARYRFSAFDSQDSKVDWIQLTAEEQKFVINVIEERFETFRYNRNDEISISPSVIGAILEKDLPTFVELLSPELPQEWAERSFHQVQYKIALSGIFTPSGIMDWDPKVGYASKFDLFPSDVIGKMNLKGNQVPETTASRLYILPENAKAMMIKVGKAVLDWAYNGMITHDREESWTSLFRRYLDHYMNQMSEVILAFPKILNDEVGLTGYHAYYSNEDGTEDTESEKTEDLRLSLALQQNGAILPVFDYSDPDPRPHPCYYDEDIFQEAPLITTADGHKYRDLREWTKKYIPDLVITAVAKLPS